MTTSDVRHTTFGLSLREPDDGDGRTLEGIIVPYGEVSEVTQVGAERFLRGSLTRSLSQRGARIKLFKGHDYGEAIGQAVGFDPEHASGCWAQFRLYSHTAGLMDQVREGALDSFSVGFRPVRSRRDAQGVVNVQEAAIHEVSLCPMGAYDGARVLATRTPERGSGPLFGPMPAVDLTPVGPLRQLWH